MRLLMCGGIGSVSKEALAVHWCPVRVVRFLGLFG